MRLTVRGGAEVMAKIMRLEQEAKVAIAKELNDSINDLQGKAIQKTPIDTGDLRGSAKVDPAKPNDLTAKLAFSTDYAISVHENRNFRARERGTGPKYLETPFMENKSAYERLIADAIKAVMR